MKYRAFLDRTDTLLERNCPSGAKSVGKNTKVVQGETLYSISRSYGVTVEAIQAMNPAMGKPADRSAIQIPERPEKPIDKRNSYQVRAGDTGTGSARN